MLSLLLVAILGRTLPGSPAAPTSSIDVAAAAVPVDSGRVSRSGGTVAGFWFNAPHTRPRRISVYTPPGYQPRGRPGYDLLLVFDGLEYLEEIPAPRILDSLIAARRIPPVVAVLVDDSSSTARLDDLANHDGFVAYVGGPLLSWVRQGWNVTRDPRRTALAGSSAGGLAAAFLALRRPDLFGNVLSQSGAFWRGAEGSNGAPFEWVTRQVGTLPKRDVRFFLDVGSLESRGALGGTAPSILDANRRLRDALRAKGYAVSYTEVRGGGHAAKFWKLRFPAGVVTLLGGGPPAR